MSEVVDLATAFVAIPSPSRFEGALADLVESIVRGAPHLHVDRIGENVIARTQLGRPRRVIIAGHLDTVALEHAEPELIDGELRGLGVVDMKGTLAAMTVAAIQLTEPAVDVTWIYYAREEIARPESGLLELSREAPDLLKGDVAILGEPTDGVVEAGCQGTLHAEVHIGGVEAHSARPFMGRNAIHRMAVVLALVDEIELRTVRIDGVDFVEQLQVVLVEGGRANNVVPASATLTINHRFAPDRSVDDARRWLEGALADVLEADLGDSVRVIESAPGALPNLAHPVLARLVELSGGAVRAKVGWTDVATFDEMGIPAANFGAGDPLLAHHRGERLETTSLEVVVAVLSQLLTDPALAR